MKVKARRLHRRGRVIAPSLQVASNLSYDTTASELICCTRQRKEDGLRHRTAHVPCLSGKSSLFCHCSPFSASEETTSSRFYRKRRRVEKFMSFFLSRVLITLACGINPRWRPRSDPLLFTVHIIQQ